MSFRQDGWRELLPHSYRVQEWQHIAAEVSGVEMTGLPVPTCKACNSLINSEVYDPLDGGNEWPNCEACAFEWAKDGYGEWVAEIRAECRITRRPRNIMVDYHVGADVDEREQFNRYTNHSALDYDMRLRSTGFDLDDRAQRHQRDVAEERFREMLLAEDEFWSSQPDTVGRRSASKPILAHPIGHLPASLTQALAEVAGESEWGLPVCEAIRKRDGLPLLVFADWCAENRPELEAAVRIVGQHFANTPDPTE